MYMAALMPQAAHERGLLGALALVYAVNPVVYISAASDLKTLSVLSPLFLIALLAIHFRRPLRERLLWFNSLFFVREEAFSSRCS